MSEESTGLPLARRLSRVPLLLGFARIGAYFIYVNRSRGSLREGPARERALLLPSLGDSREAEPRSRFALAWKLTVFAAHVDNESQRIADANWSGHSSSSGPVTVSDFHVALRRL